MAEVKKAIPSFRLSLSEEELDAVVRPLREGNLCKGTVVAALEQDFRAVLGKDHAVATSSGTASLHLQRSSCSWRVNNHH